MGKELAATALTHLGAVFSRGITSDDRSWIGAIPGLDDVLRAFSTDALLAAEHERVMGHGVYAYASVFLSDPPLRGGDIAASAQEAFAEAGVVVPDLPDGLGEQMVLYAHGLHTSPDRAEVFLADQLGRWCIPAFVAMGREESVLYTALSEVASDIMAPCVEGIDPRLPPRPPVLDSPKTGLRDIAQTLLSPVRSGWFLSRGRLTRLSREAGIPCGFGSRQQMVLALLTGSVQHGVLRATLGVLGREVGHWAERYEALGSVGWLSRLRMTERMLARLAENASS